jgi:hypothetical protein
MQYIVDIEGFENQTITIQSAGLLLTPGPKLFVDGNVPDKGPKRRQYILKRDDGTETIAKLQNVLFGFDPVPQLVIDDKLYKVLETITWYQGVWSALSILVLFLGGAIGGLFAGLAFTLNIRIFHSKLSGFVKFALSGVVSLLAVIATFIISLFLNGYLNRG